MRRVRNPAKDTYRATQHIPKVRDTLGPAFLVAPPAGGFFARHYYDMITPGRMS